MSTNNCEFAYFLNLASLLLGVVKRDVTNISIISKYLAREHNYKLNPYEKLVYKIRQNAQIR